MVSQLAVSASIEIAAPAFRIFDILADPRRHVEIDGSHMLRRCLDGPDRLRLGSELVMSMRLWGVPYRVRNRVVVVVVFVVSTSERQSLTCPLNCRTSKT